MSYDVKLFYLSGEGDPLEEARRLRNEEESSPRPEEEARRKRLVDDLLALHPSLQMEPVDDGFAYGCLIESEEPECDILPVELGVDRAFVSFSYSADSDLALESLRRIVEVFERHGFVAYDPQLDKLVSAGEGFAEGARQFEQTHDTVVEALEDLGETVIQPFRPRKPKRRRQTFLIAMFLLFLFTMILILLGNYLRI